MAACEQVFDIVELLDMILMSTLPPIDSNTYWKPMLEPSRTLLLQRVSKTFYHHINGDTELARALHLVLGGKSPMRVYVRQCYPQLVNILPPILSPAWTCNAYIDLKFTRNELNSELSFGHCNNLQLLQPPITKLGMITTNRFGSTLRSAAALPYSRGMVVCETGLTIKQVVEAGKTYLENAPKCAYYSVVAFFVRLDEEGKELGDLDPEAHTEAMIKRLGE